MEQLVKMVGSDNKVRHFSQEMISKFMNRRVLITGCSRGLGLEMSEQFMLLGAKIVATCRNPSKADSLRTRIEHYNQKDDQNMLLECDVDQVGSIEKLANELKSRNMEIDILINNAGVVSPDHPNDPITKCKVEDIKSVFNTNVIGPVVMTQQIYPIMVGLKTIVNVSSLLGSIENNSSGDKASYRISKAAVNMATKTFGCELEDFIVVSVHPGHVNTDMGSAGGRKPPVEIIDSISGLMNVMVGLSKADNGMFYNYDGKKIEW